LREFEWRWYQKECEESKRAKEVSSREEAKNMQNPEVKTIMAD
jgi:hypothetical protein